MSTYRIHINDEQQFRLAGASRWVGWGNRWLCTHDVFHHRPGEAGTMADEVMSFGAQLWLEHSSCDLTLGIDWTNLAGVLGNSYAEHLQLERFMLTTDPPEFVSVHERFRRRFEFVVELGVFEASREIDALREDAHLPAVPDAEMSAFTGPAHQERYVQWMCYGLHMAQRRFENPDAARVLSNKFAMFMQDCAEQGMPWVDLAIDESKLELTPVGERSQQLWARYQP